MTSRSAAKLMIASFGQNAARRATQRAWSWREQGDEAGYRMWIEVCLEFDQLKGLYGSWVGAECATSLRQRSP